jgi:threonine dehydrogenase-like Zn-dependent dehydrogenase
MTDKTMTALVKTAKGKGLVELREVPIPAIAEDEVLIEVKAAGLCGTDLHIFHDEFPYWPPVILGHEFAGVVAAAGRSVSDWHEGDRVVGEPHTLACGKCRLCRTGHRQLCPSKRSPGWGIDGCFARYMRFPEPVLLHRIPETLPFQEAALIEPAANVVHDVLERGTVEPADTVAVVGPGPIGIMASLAAKSAGAKQVFLFGADADEGLRLPTARHYEAIDHAGNAQREDAAAFVLERTEGRGADLVVDASGAEAGIALALKLARKCGRFAAIGLTGKDGIRFPYDAAMSKALDFFFNMSTSYTSWDRAVHFVATRRIDVRPLLTHVGGLERWADFFEAMENKTGLKGVFIP